MVKQRHPKRGSFGWYGLMDHERFELTKIDEFLWHVSSSIEQSSAPLTKKANEASSDEFEDDHEHNAYLSHLENQQYELGEIENLSHELAILALNKKAEIATNTIIDEWLPETPRKNRHVFDVLKTLMPFDLTKLPGYPERDELRLLNNAIKHEGIVTSQLSTIFPRWGDEGAPLSEIGEAYERLRIPVQSFIRAFAKECRANSKYE